MKKQKKPWMNYIILDMIKTKHQLFKKYLKNKTQGNLDAYKAKRNKIKRKIEKAKKQHTTTHYSKIVKMIPKKYGKKSICCPKKVRSQNLLYQSLLRLTMKVI